MRSVEVTLDGVLPDWPTPFILEFPDEQRAWQAKAACRGVDPDIFYPPEGSDESYTHARAEAICAVCPVQPECADHALWWPENHGYWGGMSERARRLYKRRLKAAEKRDKR